MNCTTRNDDSDLDAAIRKSLGDIIASGQPGRTASEPVAGLSDRCSGRRWFASAAAVVLVVVGLGLISVRSSDNLAPADQTSGTPTVPSRTELANGLNPGGLINPVATVFGGLVDPLLPNGYELVFASDDPEPLVVALNAGGDRFEAVIYSSESRLAEVDRVRDELQLEVPEGVLAVGPDGQPGERNAYLVTGDAIVATDYIRVADTSTIEPGSAVEIARAIARNLPPTLATGQPVGIGTGLSNDVTAVVESLAERVQESRVIVRSTRAPTVEVIGDFTSSNGTEQATVRIEMFDGFLAPTFLVDAYVRSTEQTRYQIARVGSWLVVVTVEGGVSDSSTALAAIEAVSEVLSPVTTTATTGREVPAATPSTLPTVETDPVDSLVEADCPYIVQTGDTPAAVADLFGVPIDDLTAGDSDFAGWMPGAKLLLPCNQPEDRDSTPVAVSLDESQLFGDQQPGNEIREERRYTQGDLVVDVGLGRAQGNYHIVLTRTNVAGTEEFTGEAAVEVCTGEISFDDDRLVEHLYAIPLRCSDPSVELTLDAQANRIAVQTDALVVVASLQVRADTAAVISAQLGQQYLTVEPNTLLPSSATRSVVYHGPGFELAARSIAQRYGIQDNGEPRIAPLPQTPFIEDQNTELDVLVIVGDDFGN